MKENNELPVQLGTCVAYAGCIIATGFTSIAMFDDDKSLIIRMISGLGIAGVILCLGMLTYYYGKYVEAISDFDDQRHRYEKVKAKYSELIESTEAKKSRTKRKS